MRYILLLLVLFVGCENQKIDPADVAYISVTLGKVLALNDKPVPDNVPDSDVCTNCNDVGWIGDTRVFTPCPVCNADGKKPRPASAKVETTITIYKSDSCTPCETWMTIEAPKYRAAGWEIKEVVTSDGPWPRFKVCDAKRCFEYSGYLTVEQFTKIYNK